MLLLLFQHLPRSRCSIREKRLQDVQVLHIQVQQTVQGQEKPKKDEMDQGLQSCTWQGDDMRPSARVRVTPQWASPLQQNTHGKDNPSHEEIGRDQGKKTGALLRETHGQGKGRKERGHWERACQAFWPYQWCQGQGLHSLEEGSQACQRSRQVG